ncbi:hypothetical protein ACN42_g1476 [Penicillium freii]|uniref:Uncharacterized protein n=1 Tax=Penicillium freii TaxID=48697 RepID=A0A117NRJ6_PENFR|nr:hypothetical protein ACN42_g1476 [Penicillium freii]
MPSFVAGTDCITTSPDPRSIAWLIAPEILFVPRKKGITRPRGPRLPRHSEFLDMESGVAILTNSNDEPPGHAAAEPANLPNPCQIPRDYLFSDGY